MDGKRKERGKTRVKITSLDGIPDESPVEELFAVVETARDGRRRIIKKWLLQHEAEAYARSWSRNASNGEHAQKVPMRL